MENVGKALLSLSEIEKEIVGYSSRKQELVGRRDVVASDLVAYKEEFDALEADLKQGASRQALEEHRLKDEQAKIVDRRKQLTSIGGAKVAKIVEREIDISSRTLQVLEDSAMKAVEEVDVLEIQTTELCETIASLEEQIASEGPEIEKEVSEIDGKLSECSKQREDLYTQLDLRLKHLYGRVQGRYPDSPVAMAQKGSCRSCYRALPSQTYNQILAGNTLIQCPGCQRILVYVEEEDK